MASIFIPCHKCYVISRNGAWNRNSSSRRSPLALFCKPGSSLDDRSARFPSCEDSSYGNFPILKAHFNEVAVESSSNSSPLVSTKPETSITKSKDAAVKEESSGQVAVPDTIISAFMDEVSNLVKLVDSKDIAELHLKKEGCELLIRKKEALPQPPVATSLMMQYPQAQVLPQPLVLSVSPPAQTNPVAAAPVLPLALPPPSNVGKKSSAPPLQCPMAGTFYRSPAPGEPPFVKVGDKVQKGQVVCIIEAMKLMNEIEADQSGTIVEIIAEDGKSVSLDTPLLIIQP